MPIVLRLRVPRTQISVPFDLADAVEVPAYGARSPCRRIFQSSKLTSILISAVTGTVNRNFELYERCASASESNRSTSPYKRFLPWQKGQLGQRINHMGCRPTTLQYGREQGRQAQGKKKTESRCDHQWPCTKARNRSTSSKLCRGCWTDGKT